MKYILLAASVDTSRSGNHAVALGHDSPRHNNIASVFMWLIPIVHGAVQ